MPSELRGARKHHVEAHKALSSGFAKPAKRPRLVGGPQLGGRKSQRNERAKIVLSIPRDPAPSKRRRD